MEKIQSAIAKARAARNTLAEQEADAPPPALAAAAPAEARRADSRAQPAPAPGNATEDEILERWNALPVVTLQPATMEAHRLPAYAAGPESVQFDMLRTRLLQHMAQNGWKRLAITSPGPACGKSTMAMNLAFALARLPEQRVILAEVDLRRPSIQKLLGQRHPHSFANVLAGRSGFAQNALRFGKNLAIASNEMASRSAAEALHGEGISAILDRIEADYAPTITIFDMPPVLASDDALAFAGRVDCALVLAAAETTTVKELDKCEREIASQTNVLGVVLNKCRYMDRHDSYDYY